VDQLIKRTNGRIDSFNSNIKEFLHLEFCRSEQRAYLAGLLDALGYPAMVDHLEFLSGFELRERTDTDVLEPGVRNLKA
jgi:hypothetical protein